MAIFSSLHTISPQAEPALNLQDESLAELHERPSMARMLGSACINNVQRSFKLTRLLAEALPVYRRMKRGVDEQRIKFLESKPRTRFNGTISAHRSVDRFVANFEDIREIKRQVPGATVNDVALSIVGGALRKYLQASRELPEQTMVATVPINIRGDSDQNNHGNVLSVMNVALHSEIEDPVRRLQAVHAASQEGKAFADAMGAGLLNQLCDAIYSGLASWGLAKLNTSGLLSMMPPANHTVVSNVPGLPIPFYFAGCKMVDSFGLGPLIPGTGLFHTVSSSYKELSISVVVCSEMMPDVDFYTACLATTFHELLASVRQDNKTRPASKKVATKKLAREKLRALKLPTEDQQLPASSRRNPSEVPAPLTRQ